MWRFFQIVIFVFLLIPVVAWLTWKFKAETPVNLLVIDKTIPNEEFSEHLSFFWMINHERWVKPNGEEYDYKKDFFGFHPKLEGNYVIKDLEVVEKNELSRLADSLDVVFLADTYGIFNSNWKWSSDYEKDTDSLIYGGLQTSEFNLLREMKRKGKTILAEFNLFASPTSSVVRKQTEELLGVKWSGWVGKYYQTLDTSVNDEISAWVPRLYEKNYKEAYNFKKGGIVLVGNKEQIVILEDETHLKQVFPELRSELSTQLQYNVPEKIDYPYWFDITLPDSRNHTLAWFHIRTNEKGKALLDSLEIPSRFPAILEHDENYHFLYFACDFSDNPIGMYTSYFRGVGKLKKAFYNPEKTEDRKSFFWEYYRPFMETVMDRISEQKLKSLEYID